MISIKEGDLERTVDALEARAFEMQAKIFTLPSFEGNISFNGYLAVECVYPDETHSILVYDPKNDSFAGIFPNTRFPRWSTIGHQLAFVEKGKNVTDCPSEHAASDVLVVYDGNKKQPVFYAAPGDSIHFFGWASTSSCSNDRLVVMTKKNNPSSCNSESRSDHAISLAYLNGSQKKLRTVSMQDSLVNHISISKSGVLLLPTAISYGPDGRFITFEISNPNGDYSVLRENGMPVISPGAYCYAIALSCVPPDERGVVVKRIGDGKRSFFRIADANQVIEERVLWSPDSRNVIVPLSGHMSTHHKSLVSIDVHKGTHRVLPNPPAVEFNAVHWAEVDKIYYGRNDELTCYKTYTGSAKNIKSIEGAREIVDIKRQQI